MKLVDEKSWLEMKLAYEKAGGAQGKAICEFAEDWANKIEGFLAETPHNFRVAMDSTVAECDYEKITSSMFAEVLSILSQVWKLSDEFIGNLTYIERRMFETNIADKLQAFEESAKSTSENP